MSTVLGYTFKDKKLYEQALTHVSHANEKLCSSYERLEYLGDSILGFVVAEYLYKKYPGSNVRDLTEFRKRVVNNDTLAKLITKTNIPAKIKLGSSFKLKMVKDETGINSDVFESLVGAVYLDGGLNEAKKFILNNLDIDSLKNINEDYITLLKEYCEQKKQCEPTYEVLKENNLTKVKIYINNNLISEEEGINIKEAKQAAAGAAVKQLKIKL